MSDAIKALNTPGGVAVIATDTLYGVVARAQDEAATRRLYQLKRRETKPGTIIAASIDQLVELGLKRRYLKAVESYWPGAVSVVIPVADPALAYLHQGAQSLAVRIPSDPRLQAMLEQTGALVTSSANQPGEPPASTVAAAKACFGDAVDTYQDSGDLAGREPSTVIRIVDDAVEVLRAGAVTIGPDGTIAA